MPASNDVVFALKGRTGKIFEVGAWPDKGFSMTTDELAAAAAAFTPVPLDLEHMPTILDGKLGQLSRVWVDGQTLFGEATFAPWLDELMQRETTRVSPTWDRKTKKLTKLALTLSPRISDAQLAAAFSSYTQQEDAMPTEPNDTQADEKVQKGIIEGITAFVTGLLKNVQPATLETAIVPQPGAGTETKAFSVADDKATKDQEARFTAMQKQLDTMRTGKISLEAQTFADGEVRAGRAFPYERDGLIAAFTDAAEDDHANPREVSFSIGSGDKAETKKGSRVDALLARQQQRKPHELDVSKLDKDQMAALFNAKPPQGDEVTSARQAELLGQSVLGRAILDTSKKTPTT